MIRLRDLTVRDARSWEDASARFRWPDGDSYNIAQDCLTWAEDAPALIVYDGTARTTVTFGELNVMSAAVARHLTAAMGVQPGDRVAVKLAQGLDMAVAVLGVLRTGAVLVPISNVLGPDAVRHRIETSGPRVLIAASDKVSGITVLSTTGDTFAGLLRAPDAPRGFAPTTPDSPALVLFTSGTTGKSKGVLHGHRFLLGHHGADYAFDLVRPDDVAYTPADWAWGGGLMLGLLVPLAHGIPIVAHRDQRFDADATMQLFADCGVSIGLFPPTVLRLLRQAGSRRDEHPGLRLRCLITGAEAVEPELLSWALEVLGATVNNAYGQTEANALVGHSSVLGPLSQRALGRPYPGHNIALLDEAGQPLPAGELGELAVRATDPVCMLGYWGAPEATAAKVHGGWLRTGDTVHVDPDGQLHFHGRKDDLIKSSGYRIGPAEVEGAILLDPSVAECAVVGLPDAVRGQVVTAYVRLRDGADETPGLRGELQRLVRETVGSHAYPRDVHVVDTLPHTTTGKIDRATLRRAAAETAPTAGRRA